MVPADHLLAFAVASVILAAIPGPSMLFIVSRSIALGRAAGLATVAGNAMGIYVHVLAVAFGLGAIVERSLVVFNVIKFAGALYLVYLGITAIRNRARLADMITAAVAPKSKKQILREGFIVGVTNPKLIIFLSAVLPQFVDPGTGHIPLQLLTLGLLFVVVALVGDGCWAVAAAKVREWLAGSPNRLRMIGGASGLIMVALGTRLAITGRKD